MSHPLCWPKYLSARPSSKFYPLGQSPIVSLTERLSSDQPAAILLLQCNALDDILFTLHRDREAIPEPRQIDITCCNDEPAIIARNILVFTLIHDNAPIEQIWNIYYHFKFDERASDLLTRQSRTLAEMSTSLETWSRSRYHAFIKIIDSSSLAELHKCWNLYADFQSLPAHRIAKLESEQAEWSEVRLRRLRSSAFYSTELGSASDQIGWFVRTGTTSYNINNPALNPTWIYASHGERFDPQSAQDIFHHITAFIPDPRDSQEYFHLPLKTFKDQFPSRCEAFRGSLRARAITIRFYVGDALPFCSALRCRGANPNQTFRSHWHGHAINLLDYFSSTPAPPSTFDLIDTARLGCVDNVGLINILLATNSLRRSPQSSIYTELTSASDRDVIERYIGKISEGVSAFTVLMGLVHYPYVSNYSYQCVGFKYQSTSPARYDWRGVETSNRDSQPRGPTLFTVSELSGAFLSLYRQMYQRNTALESESKNSSALDHSYTRKDPSLTRESIALLFQGVREKGNLALKGGSWQALAHRFLGLVKTDKSASYETKYYEDLRLQLSLSGFLPLTSSDVKCIVLSIPSNRPELQVLRQRRETTIPRLACGLRDNANNLHIFDSLHGTWGRLVPSHSGGQSIEDAPVGTSNLIVSFWAPTVLLRGAEVSLVVHFTSAWQGLYQYRLDEAQQVWSSKIGGEHVKVLSERPMANGMTQLVPMSAPASPAEDVSFEVQGYWKGDLWYIKDVTARLNLTHDEIEVLRTGVKATMMQVEQRSIKIGIGEYDHTISFDFPVRENKIKLKVSRKFEYIEMIAKVYHPNDFQTVPWFVMAVFILPLLIIAFGYVYMTYIFPAMEIYRLLKPFVIDAFHKGVARLYAD